SPARNIFITSVPASGSQLCSPGIQRSKPRLFSLRFVLCCASERPRFDKPDSSGPATLPTEARGGIHSNRGGIIVSVRSFYAFFYEKLFCSAKFECRCLQACSR